MPNKKPNERKEEQTPRDNPALATDDVNLENEQMSTDDDQSSGSLQNASSECGGSSASPSANTTCDISFAHLPNEPRPQPEGKETTPKPYNVKAEFFREESELQSSTEVQESQSNSSLTGSTTRLCHPPTPPVDERRPPGTLAVPPINLNIPTISLSKDESVEDPSAGGGSSKGMKSKGALGDAFNKLVVRLSPRKEKLSPSDTSVSQDTSISAEKSTSSTFGKPKSKKSSPLKFLFRKPKSLKDSPDKKEKSPSKFKSLVENALHPKKLFLQRSSAEGSDHLCDFEDPPKTKIEKPKSSKTYWEDVEIPKDFKKVESTNFSDTTVDSCSTQLSFTTDSPMSDIINTNQGEVDDNNPRISPIPESTNPDSDKDEESEE